MIYFRFHRGTLDESLKTIIEAPTSQSLIDAIKQSDEAKFLDIDTLQCRYYGIDQRDQRFSRTYIVTASLVNNQTEQPIVIGFSSEDITIK